MHVPTGYGRKGIHDHIACVPMKITQTNIGQTIGVFVSIEAKQLDKIMSSNQEDIAAEIDAACGLTMVVDGTRDEPGSFKKFEAVMKSFFGEP
jgi:hypothetical protein